MTGLASEVGTANPTPFEPPPAVRMTVLMPMACPRTLIRGPPLFPGLMEASVWMNSSYGPRADHAPHRADDAGRHGLLESEGIPDRYDRFAHLHAGGVAERDDG
jgi:hypothetical protein